MGQKISDGKAFTAVAPNSQVINDFDLYRIGKWNGVAVGAKDATQTDRTMAFEMDPAAIYSILLPSGINPAAGAFLYWANPAIFQRGDTNLQVAAAAEGDEAAFKVTVAKNSAGYAQGRVLNGMGGGGAEAVGMADVTPQATTPALSAVDSSYTIADTDIDGTPSHANVEAAIKAGVDPAVQAVATKVNTLITKLEAAGVLT